MIIIMWCGVCVWVSAEENALITAPPSPEITIMSWDMLRHQPATRKVRKFIKRYRYAWMHGKSEHFYGHAATLDQLTEGLELAEFVLAWLDEVFNKAHDTRDEEGWDLILIADPNLWEHLLKDLDARPDGLAINSKTDLIIHVDKDRTKYVKSVGHEMVHKVLTDYYGSSVPLWLEEGLAETLGLRATKMYMKKKGKNLTHKESSILPAHLIPLEELLQLKQLPATPERAIAFYRQSEHLANTIVSWIGKNYVGEFMESVCKDRENWRDLLTVRYRVNPKSIAALEDQIKAALLAP